MIENLIILERKNLISKFLRNLLSYFEKIPIIKRIISELSISKTLNKFEIKKCVLKKNNTIILYIDKLVLIKYQIPLKEYRKRHVSLLKQVKDMFDYLELHTNKYNKDYRNLDMNIVYKNNLLVLLAYKFIYLYLPIQILLEKYEIKNIYIPEEYELVYDLFKLESKENNVNIIKIRKLKSERVLNRIIIYLNNNFKLIQLFILKKKSRYSSSQYKTEKFDTKFIFNEGKNIGFLYFGLTHKRVGLELFNYLKKKQINVIEVNPNPSKSFLDFKQIKHFRITRNRILIQIKNLYKEYIKEFKNPLFVIYLKYALKSISKQIELDLYKIDYIYEKMKVDKINLLFIFNDNSFLGKVSALICKQLEIPTIYIVHGSITEPYIFIFPRWCDIMILNSKIEKEFLLNKKLDPKVYSERLLPIGGSYYKPSNLKSLNKIQDEFNKKIYDISQYKYIILCALSSDVSRTFPLINFRIINDLIKVIKSLDNAQDILLIIKLHPSDNILNYKNLYIEKLGIPTILSHKIDIRRLIISVDLFLSVPSTTLLEGLLLKTPTILLDYYYNPNNYLFIDKDVITTVRNQNELKKQLKKHLFDKNFRSDYIKRLYSFGLLFCEGYEKKNFNEDLNQQILDIIEKLI